ncbi:MAG: hypothetical protein JJU29_19700 [Verrucomicrobia bacterium]|nr:hypothetical protein [Verrucomicrobiota bacterium]MCH8510859.1 hypothetical protein [Kiritimatiellia bacterium]
MNFSFRLKVSGLLMLLLMPVSLYGSPEASAAEEEALDTRLGIESRSFDVNLVALRSRSQLREAAGVRTGLPTYDQQVENAEGAPAALLAELRPSPQIQVRAERRSTAPATTDSPESQPPPQSPNLQNCPLTHVGPCP